MFKDDETDPRPETPEEAKARKKRFSKRWLAVQKAFRRKWGFPPKHAATPDRVHHARLYVDLQRAGLKCGQCGSPQAKYRPVDWYVKDREGKRCIYRFLENGAPFEVIERYFATCNVLCRECWRRWKYPNYGRTLRGDASPEELAKERRKAILKATRVARDLGFPSLRAMMEAEPDGSGGSNSGPASPLLSPPSDD